jgi:enoyl-CoA hydratase/carnithine racemase
MTDTRYDMTFKTVDLGFSPNGVLTVRFHSRGKALRWTALPHRELPVLFDRIASDPGVRVVVITGTGDSFIEFDPEFETAIAEGKPTPDQMDAGTDEGVRLLENLLRIQVPVIAAVNGPALVHAEIALLSDIVLSTDTACFEDAAHVPSGLVPSDGVQIVWPWLLGPNRARYFLLTGQRIQSDEARALGLVAEILAPDELMPRALEHAERLAELNPVVVRNVRHALVSSLRRKLSDELHYGLLLESMASLSGRDWAGSHTPRAITPHPILPNSSRHQ